MKIGKTIKTIAIIFCSLVALASIIVGITFRATSFAPEIGCVLLYGGPVLSFLIAIFFYGYGELICKTAQIEINTRGGNRSPQNQQMQLEKFERFRDNGLISEEDYQRALQKNIPEPSSASPAQQNAAEELKKYEDLLKQGILTEEEFQAKKEQFLKLI